MIGRFLRTHRAIYGDRDRVYHAAIGEDRGLVSPWLILGVGMIMLGALDLWLFAGASLFDDAVTPCLPWNILAPQIMIWPSGVIVISVVMAMLGAPTQPMIIARLWAYVMGHVATVMPPVLLTILGLRSLLLESTTIAVPAALLFSTIALAVVIWLGADCANWRGAGPCPPSSPRCWRWPSAWRSRRPKDASSRDSMTSIWAACGQASTAAIAS